ncbi:hypothetical protein BJ508DRAFT_330986 [Ascobolus immersus RN42]|uniref:Uncharacterized protein n=1 Tax=Ascobolus immersus RN42 TaxID=1160509 RepID=A0A3N4HRU0_ASCIM|nr:hypothetical protein BJ508DRAFT_330986 [Ascobolus immersus RN42]
MSSFFLTEAVEASSESDDDGPRSDPLQDGGRMGRLPPYSTTMDRDGDVDFDDDGEYADEHEEAEEEGEYEDNQSEPNSQMTDTGSDLVGFVIDDDQDSYDPDKPPDDLDELEIRAQETRAQELQNRRLQAQIEAEADASDDYDPYPTDIADFYGGGIDDEGPHFSWNEQDGEEQLGPNQEKVEIQRVPLHEEESVEGFADEEVVERTNANDYEELGEVKDEPPDDETGIVGHVHHDMDRKQRSDFLKQKRIQQELVRRQKKEEALRREAEERRQEASFHIPDEIVTRDRIKGKYKKYTVRPGEAPRDGLRIALELQDATECCRLRASVRRDLIAAGIDVTKSWKWQTREDRILAIRTVMEVYGEQYPGWAKDAGIIRMLLLYTLGDCQRTTRLKERGYQSYEQAPARAPRTKPGFFKGDQVRKALEASDRRDQAIARLTGGNTTRATGASSRDQVSASVAATSQTPAARPAEGRSAPAPGKPAPARPAAARPAPALNGPITVRPGVSSISTTANTGPAKGAGSNVGSSGVQVRVKPSARDPRGQFQVASSTRPQPRHYPQTTPAQSTPGSRVVPKPQANAPGCQNAPIEIDDDPPAHAKAQNKRKADDAQLMPPPTSYKRTIPLPPARPASLRVEFVETATHFRPIASFVMVLFKKSTLRTFIVNVENAIEEELNHSGAFLAYMDIDEAEVDTKPRWTLLRDLRTIIVMFIRHSRGQGVYMTELSFDFLRDRVKLYELVNEFSLSTYAQMIKREDFQDRDVSSAFATEAYTLTDLQEINFQDIEPYSVDDEGNLVEPVVETVWGRGGGIVDSTVWNNPHSYWQQLEAELMDEGGDGLDLEDVLQQHRELTAALDTTIGHSGRVSRRASVITRGSVVASRAQSSLQTTPAPTNGSRPDMSEARPVGPTRIGKIQENATEPHRNRMAESLGITGAQQADSLVGNTTTTRQSSRRPPVRITPAPTNPQTRPQMAGKRLPSDAAQSQPQTRPQMAGKRLPGDAAQSQPQTRPQMAGNEGVVPEKPALQQHPMFGGKRPPGSPMSTGGESTGKASSATKCEAPSVGSKRRGSHSSSTIPSKRQSVQASHLSDIVLPSASMSRKQETSTSRSTPAITFRSGRNDPVSAGGIGLSYGNSLPTHPEFPAGRNLLTKQKDQERLAEARRLERDRLIDQITEEREKAARVKYAALRAHEAAEKTKREAAALAKKKREADKKRSEELYDRAAQLMSEADAIDARIEQQEDEEFKIRESNRPTEDILAIPPSNVSTDRSVDMGRKIVKKLSPSPMPSNAPQKPASNPHPAPVQKPASNAPQKPPQKPQQMPPQKPPQKPASDPPQKPQQMPPQKLPQKPASDPPQKPQQMPPQKLPQKPASDPPQKPQQMPPQKPQQMPPQKPQQMPPQKPQQMPPQKPASMTTPTLANTTTAPAPTPTSWSQGPRAPVATSIASQSGNSTLLSEALRPAPVATRRNPGKYDLHFRNRIPPAQSLLPPPSNGKPTSSTGKATPTPGSMYEKPIPVVQVASTPPIAEPEGDDQKSYVIIIGFHNPNKYRNFVLARRKTLLELETGGPRRLIASSPSLANTFTQTHVDSTNVDHIRNHLGRLSTGLATGHLSTAQILAREAAANRFDSERKEESKNANRRAERRSGFQSTADGEVGGEEEYAEGQTGGHQHSPTPEPDDPDHQSERRPKRRVTRNATRMKTVLQVSSDNDLGEYPVAEDIFALLGIPKNGQQCTKKHKAYKQAIVDKIRGAKTPGELLDFDWAQYCWQATKDMKFPKPRAKKTGNRGSGVDEPAPAQPATGRSNLPPIHQSPPPALTPPPPTSPFITVDMSKRPSGRR